MKKLAAAIVLLAFSSLAQGQQPEDAVARQAIVSAMTQNDNGLRQAYGIAQQRGPAAGQISMADAVYYLYNCTRESRDEFLSGQEILAANTKDKDWRNRVIQSLLTDEVYELNRLEGQNRFNKYTRIFNRVSTSLSQLVLLQPQAAASLLWDGIYGFKQGKSATVKERKMVFLCEQFLKKYPEAPERGEVLNLQQELKHKMLSDRAKALAEAGRTAISEGKFQLAEWHLEKAALLNPADTDVNQLLASARTLRNRSEEILGLTLGVADSERQLTAEQSNAIGSIARAMINSKTEPMTKMRQTVPSVWDSVDYGFAALSEKSGEHANALNRLQNLAASSPNSPGGRAATKLLDNPNYNLSESFQKALAEMTSDQKKFIWSGRRSKDDTVYTAGSTVIQNAGNPVAVPVLFGMDAAVRAISEKFKTQVSVDGVIDAGARYLRKYPETAQSKQIAQQLATLSKKAGDYKRSMEYLEESGGGTPEEVAKLKENQAVALYEQIKTSSDLLQKRKLLQKLTSEYAEAKITKKNAATEQAKLPPALADDTIVLPAKALQKDPRLAQYLGVPTYLVDGSKGNGEVTDEGIAITPGSSAVEFKLKNEQTWRRGALSKEGRDWILTAAKQLRQEYMTATESSDQRQRLPFAVEGGVGSSGIDVAPKILPYPTSQKDKDRFD